MSNYPAKRSIAIMVALLLFSLCTDARCVVRTSDKICPHWVERIDDIYRYNSSYEYKCIIDEGRDLQSLKDNRLLNFALYMQRTNKIDGTIDRNVLSENINGNINTRTTYKIAYQTRTSVEEFDCVVIDEYWELDNSGTYRLYSLFAVSVMDVIPQFDIYTTSTHYAPSEGLVRSMLPGWGQIYKGSKVKGSLIILGEALGIGGIVFSYSMKSSYEKLMYEDPKHRVDYSMSADMWHNIGYGTIAFATAVYIYNLIDAAVAPGARRVIVLPQQQTLMLSPFISRDNNGLGITLKYNF